MLLNFSALDPALTESKCSFWHFRFEPHTDMQLNAMTSYMAAQRSIEKVYLINQDYAFGQAVSRTSREQLNAKRRAIAIVGDELVPLAKVKDFAPYVAKIRASGADSILTSNWGGDLTLLLKASSEMGLKANYYSLQAALFGTAAAVRAAGAANVKALWSWHLNATEGAWEQRILESRTKYKTNADLAYMPAFRTIEMFAAAVDLAGSTEPRKIAYAIEGLHWNGPTGDSWMRAEDHKVVAPMMLMSFAKAGTQGVRHDIEGTGYGWKTDVVVPAKDMVPPLRCTMARPPG